MGSGGLNPKYWAAAMSCGIFFEIWPFENAHCLFKTPLWGVIKARSSGPGFFTLIKGLRLNSGFNLLRFYLNKRLMP